MAYHIKIQIIYSLLDHPTCSARRRLLHRLRAPVQDVQRRKDDRRGRRVARDEEGPLRRGVGPRRQLGGRTQDSSLG